MLLCSRPAFYHQVRVFSVLEAVLNIPQECRAARGAMSGLRRIQRFALLVFALVSAPLWSWDAATRRTRRGRSIRRKEHFFAATFRPEAEADSGYERFSRHELKNGSGGSDFSRPKFCGPR